jgi:hypothetical protein
MFGLLSQDLSELVDKLKKRKSKLKSARFAGGPIEPALGCGAGLDHKPGKTRKRITICLT